MRIRHLAEYLGLRIALFLVDRLPTAAAEKLARRLADLWYRLNPARRHIAIGNLLRSGVAASPQDAARIARASFEHFAVIIVESLKSGEVFTPTNWRERVTLDIDPQSMALFEKPGQGVIVVSAHFGNWEIAAQLISHIKPVTGIARKMNNPHTDKLVKKRQPRNRFQLTPKHHTNAGRLLATLRDGHILAMMVDQHARERGMMVDFFGTPASTHTSPALLHLVTRTPLCVGYCLRTGPMQYEMVVLPPLDVPPTGNKDNDIRRVLEAVNRRLEDAIRRYPEQYLWAHRRWRKSNGPAAESPAPSAEVKPERAA